MYEARMCPLIWTLPFVSKCFLDIPFVSISSTDALLVPLVALLNLNVIHGRSGNSCSGFAC